MIKVSLTNKQCDALIKMVYIGECVYNALTDEKNTEIEKCMQTVYAQIAEQGFRDYFDADKDKGKWYLNEKQETECIDTIERHTLDAFWDHLTDYLTERDLRQNYSDEELNRMDQNSFLELVRKIQDNYNSEFENNGVDNLALNPSLPDFLKEPD